MIEISVKGSILQISKQFPKITDQMVMQAANRAINRAIESARSSAVREIRKMYNIDKKYLSTKEGSNDRRNAVKLWRARGKDMTGKILASGRPIPLIAFPVEEQDSGVSVSVIKGKSENIRGAFVQQMKSGHIGVFARGRYSKGVLEFRKSRVKKYPAKDLPVTQIMSTQIRSAIAQPSVISVMEKKANEIVVKRFKHEISRLIT